MDGGASAIAELGLYHIQTEFLDRFRRAEKDNHERHRGARLDIGIVRQNADLGAQGCLDILT